MPRTGEPFLEQCAREFWHWWEQNAASFANDIERGNASDWSGVLSARIASVHPELGWETGPGRKSAHHLALTAEGNPELRIVAERVLSRSPQPDAHWEYYAARQRASGDPIRRVEFDDGLEVDYGLIAATASHDELWEELNITLFHPVFAELDEARAGNIAFLFLDTLVGEDDVERWIGDVKTVRARPDNALTAVELRVRVDELAAEGASGNASIVEFKHNASGRRLVASWRASLKRLDYLLYENHVEVVLALNNADDRGLCDNAELEYLADIENELLQELGNDAVFFGHVTGHGRRTIRFQCLAMSPATAVLESWIERHPEYEISYATAADPTWKGFRSILGSLDDDLPVPDPP
jgi:hypothetical protein